MQRSEAGDALGTVGNSPQPARCHLLADVGSLSAFNVAWHIIPTSHRVADWLQTPLNFVWRGHDLAAMAWDTHKAMQTHVTIYGQRLGRGRTVWGSPPHEPVVTRGMATMARDTRKSQ